MNSPLIRQRELLEVVVEVRGELERVAGGGLLGEEVHHQVRGAEDPAEPSLGDRRLGEPVDAQPEAAHRVRPRHERGAARVGFGVRAGVERAVAQVLGDGGEHPDDGPVGQRLDDAVARRHHHERLLAHLLLLLTGGDPDRGAAGVQQDGVLVGLPVAREARRRPRRRSTRARQFWPRACQVRLPAGLTAVGGSSVNSRYWAGCDGGRRIDRRLRGRDARQLGPEVVLGVHRHVGVLS